jgi:hypothetical protein
MCFFAILRYKVDSVIAMRLHNVLEVLFTIALFAGTPVRVWSQNAPGSARAGCVVKLAGVQLNCPAGWQIVEETDRGTAIGNFDRPDKTGNLTIPVGRATIEFHPMPVNYKNFKEWVHAATKLAPDAIQTNKSLVNKSVGSIGAVCFTAPNSQRGWIYESYFFEINGTPINLELNYQRTSQNASEYRAILDKLVESLEAPRH